MSLSPLVLIPARLASERLPNKPLADIHGQPMILHTLARALEADIGPVAVAAADQEIVDAVTAAGHQAVLTNPAHPSGSDRIHEAVNLLDPDGRYDVVINAQGDYPTLDPATIRASLAPLQADSGVDIATLAAVVQDEAERDDPNTPKIVAGFLDEGAPPLARALYFSRATLPWGAGPVYHHIGLYAFRRAALDRFVDLPPSLLERRERLEQLRALENGMRMDAALVDAVPVGVDTPEDLERARALLKPH